jgi:hypothetical protein
MSSVESYRSGRIRARSLLLLTPSLCGLFACRSSTPPTSNPLAYQVLRPVYSSAPLKQRYIRGYGGYDYGPDRPRKRDIINEFNNSKMNNFSNNTTNNVD